jgi:hypothetical protein
MEVEQSSKIQLPAELTDLHGAPDYMWSERSPHAPGVRGLAAMQIAMADRTATHERPLRFDESAQEKEITWPDRLGLERRTREALCVALQRRQRTSRPADQTAR